ncbi:CobW family GTP-binding protein [Pseudonocardia phyllosphaerae]|uniref:CobW family GTP-binding protein n=1 Tax=Pseudonocardia phyllosphaerae TaxID=3390502 RepID=UPI00397909B0
MVDRRVPVTILSGLAGSATTALLARLLANTDGRRIAAVVPGAGPPGAAAAPGCLCCAHRADVLAAVGELAATGRYDHVVVEAGATTEPVAVAAMFDWAGPQHDVGPGARARLDAMVTVVDATTFETDLTSADTLAERGLAGGSGARGPVGGATEDDRTVADLLAEQVEFADVVVLARTADVPPTRPARLEALLRRLNPRARLHRDDAPLTALLDTPAPQPVPAVPETTEHGISSVTWRARRPFHPARLLAALDDWPGLLRSRGYCWIASRPELAGLWSQTGPHMALDPMTAWSAWDGPRGHEIVFIGLGLTRDGVTRRLDPALLTDDELLAGPDAWRCLPDPLPSWDPGPDSLPRRAARDVA